MMKNLILVLTLVCHTLFPHGFGKNVSISLANNYYQTIGNLCQAVRTKTSNPHLLTYKTKTKTYTPKQIRSVATGTTNCYFKIGFDTSSSYPDIICTPDQEFYSAHSNIWIPAYHLKIGDPLLGKYNTVKTITHIEFINEPTDVFILEVKNTHTFFVGTHAILTHNIILPLCVNMSIPIASATGATIGGCFGPIACTAGIIAGSIIGVIAKILQSNLIPSYKLPNYDICALNRYREGLIYDTQDKHNDAQAPGKPTEKDGFIPPKKWDGKKVKDPEGSSYGWPDRKGHVWIPTGPNGHRGPHWDVQDPKTGKHRNILPGGKIC